MLENVVWNTSALIIKGDDHNVTLNTVFDGSDIGDRKAQHDHPRYQDHTSGLDNLTILSAAVGASTKHGYDPRANNKTVFERNVFDSVDIKGDRCPDEPCVVPGRYRENLIGTETPFNMKEELRDPFHLDFRPCPGSQVAGLAAGAYATYSSSDTSYWIPGRRERTLASTPVPPTGSVAIHSDAELMFLPAVLATGHSVYLAKSGDEWTLLQELDGPDSNIARPPPLEGHVEYQWRVDTQLPGGETVTGYTWTFETRAKGSCESTFQTGAALV